MKIVEVNDLILKTLKDQPEAVYQVASISTLGQVLLKSGPFNFRVKLNSTLHLKKKDKVTINPDTLAVHKV